MQLFRRESKGIPVTPVTGSKETTPVTGGSYTENVVYANTDEKAMRIAAVYRAVNLISSSAAVLTLRYKRKDRVKDYFKIYDSGDGKNELPAWGEAE